MKKTFYSLLIASVMTLCAQGAEATAQAIVLAVKGPVSAVVSGGKAAPLKVGDKLSVGTLITTAPGGEADIQVFNGAVATIRPDTTCTLEKLSVTASGGVVTKQTALLNLKVGTIASNIDSANRNINDYGIRTPKGVAAARGTSYTVNVTPTGRTQVFVTNSVVTFNVTTTVNGVTSTQTITVPAGSQVTVDATGVIAPVVQLTPAQLQQANADGQPLDPASITTNPETTGDGTPPQPPTPPPVIIDPSPAG